MENNVENSISTESLLAQYNWYQDTFSAVVQEASDTFFEKNFQVEFIGLSKNINCLLNDESCFVTKVKIEKDYDMFFRLTEKTIEIVLDKCLGKSKGRFNINKISELESKIITAFNAFIYNALKDKLNHPDPKELKRTNFDMINLTFILKDLDPNIKSSGKVIVTLPEGLLAPENVVSKGDKFSKADFDKSEVTANIVVGTTTFTLYELKNLEVDDVVVFENSTLGKYRLLLLGEEMEVNVSPNMDLLVNYQNDTEGDNMAEARNIWDRIEVDLNAEFDAVKVTLGELKKIEEGLVVDIASLYNNKITLKVEDIAIATGSLVIVNDRYGVKVDKVLAKGDAAQAAIANNVSESEDTSEQESFEQPETQEQPAQEATDYSEQATGEEENGEEDFDYSDFELDDDEGI